MKIGIVGPAERTLAWENHVRPHPSVSEVIIAATLNEIGSVDACLLLDETDQRWNHLLQSIKSGLHTFFISKLPTDHTLAKKVYHASQEANVRVQFSHWPSIAPTSQWMKKHIPTPSFIQIIRRISSTYFLEHNLQFSSLWIDDLAYCLKYVNGAVHTIDVNTSTLQSGKPHAIHIMLRFDSGTTAALFISACAHRNQHQRFVSNHSLTLDCNVEKQTVRMGRENSSGHFFFEKKSFDSSLAAEKAVTQFLKAIQLRKPSLYGSYDLLKLTDVVRRIKSRL